MAGNLLHYADYIIVVLVLIISLAIGVSISYVSGRNKSTTSEYLMGSRQMSLIPVIISLTVSFVSAITMLGFATEAYFFGITYMMLPIAQMLGVIMAALTFVPLFYQLNITSGNEYLQLRFRSRSVALYGVITQLLMMYALSGVFMVGPALMFEAVSGCPVWASLLILGVCGTIYTSIGGYKAVIWTDVFQACVMVIGQIAILIQGTITVGGTSKVLKMYSDGGGFNMKFVPAPLEPHDFWSLAIVMSFSWFIMFGSLQISVQRYLSLPTLTKAKVGLLSIVPGLFLFTFLSSFCGVVAYAYYTDIGCDPLAEGRIRNINQILPLFVIDVLKYPGLAGIFVAGVFCGSLSSYSTTISALGAFTWADLLASRFENATPKMQTLVTRMLSIFNGCISLGVSYLISAMSSSLVSLIVAVVTTLITPLAVMFIQGATFPRINWKSTLVSAFVTAAIFMTCCIGNRTVEQHIEYLPLVDTNCTTSATSVKDVLMPNITHEHSHVSHLSHRESTTMVPVSGGHGARSASEYFFKLNTIWYMPLGMLVGCIVGFVVSLIPGFHEEKPVPAKYFFPYVRWVLGMKKYEECSQDEEKKVADDDDAETTNDGLEENQPLATETRATKLYKPDT